MAILLKGLSSILVNTPHGITRVDLNHIKAIEPNGEGSLLTLQGGIVVESIESVDEIQRVKSTYAN